MLTFAKNARTRLIHVGLVLKLGMRNRYPSDARWFRSPFNQYEVISTNVFHTSTHTHKESSKNAKPLQGTVLWSYISKDFPGVPWQYFYPTVPFLTFSIVLFLTVTPLSCPLHYSSLFPKIHNCGVSNYNFKHRNNISQTYHMWTSFSSLKTPLVLLAL